ncbi:hypothetical protein ACFVZW_32270, partial [Streptomyces sp. NPDC059567]
MGTSGNSFSPVGARAALTLLLAGILMAGCSSARPDPEPTPRESSAPAPRPTALAAACEVRLPASWSSALAAGELRAPAGERAVLTDTGPGWTAVQLTAAGQRPGPPAGGPRPPPPPLTPPPPAAKPLLPPLLRAPAGGA